MHESPHPAPPQDAELEALLAFTPVPSTTNRHDGWTPHRQRQFVRALSVVGTVSGAAKMVGISSAAAYKLRTRPGAESFVLAWDTALQIGRDRAFDIAVDRALNGYERPRYYRGVQVATVRVFDSRTIRAALAPPHAYDNFTLSVGSERLHGAEGPRAPEAVLRAFLAGLDAHE